MNPRDTKNTNRKNVQPDSLSFPKPPVVSEVKVYFLQRGMTELEAEHFFLFYEKKGWKNGKGQFMHNWKSLAYKRIHAILQEQPWRFDKTIH